MFIYNPKDLYHAWPAFYAFVDFLIRMINEDKVKVNNSNSISGGLTQFEIWLVESNDLEEQLKISFAYMPFRGIYVGHITPIRSFELSLIKSVVVLFHAESRDPKSYDKMLELFKTVMSYLERNNPDYHERVLKRVDMESLERKNWKKSRQDIQKELDKKWETRKAADDFQREMDKNFANLLSEYSSQGYEIID